MRTSPRLALAASSFVSLLLACGCSAPSVTLYPRVAFVPADGDITADDSSAAASSDAEALGIDDDETVFAPRADLDWGRWHLTLDGLDLSRDGSGTAEAEIEIGGTTISAGEDVDTDLDLKLASASMVFDFLPAPNAELGLGLGVVYADFAADITSQTSGDTASTDEQVPLPVVAARAGVSFGRFSLGALARGLDVKIDDVDATYIDLDAHARWDLFEATEKHLRGGIVVGWRRIDFDAEFDDGSSRVDADLEFSGPYAGIAFTF